MATTKSLGKSTNAKALALQASTKPRMATPAGNKVMKKGSQMKMGGKKMC